MNEEIHMNYKSRVNWDSLHEKIAEKTNDSHNVEHTILTMKNISSLIEGESKPQLANKDKETFTCSICYKVLSNRNSLRVHLRKHSDLKRFCCEHCGKLFSQNAALNGHLTKVHCVNPETAVICYVCNKEFCRKSALKIHMATHLGFKPFSCKICSKRFSQKVTRDVHILTHAGKYDYSCSNCSRKFSTRYKLNYHMKSHNLPEYHCLLCLKQFTNKQDLDLHCDSHNSSDNLTSEVHLKNIQEGDNINLVNNDYLNNVMFISKNKMPNDENTQNKQKIFLCNFCGCNFEERKSLLHHIKMRHAVTPTIRHSCMICSKTFSEKSTLTSHLKRHTEVYLQRLWEKVRS